MLEEALSISIKCEREFGKVQFNSLSIEKDDLFIALKGQRDGHEFVRDALERGAGGAIVSRSIENVDPSKLIIVEDSFAALEKLARYKRETSGAKFIAVTGSVGKTTTKEALHTMLSAYGEVSANRGTFNNYLGVLLTLASISRTAEYAIIEAGMNAKGELAELSKLIRPDIGVIVSVSEGHIEFFNSVEEICDAKCEIFLGMNAERGIAIINQDISTYQRCLDNLKVAAIRNIRIFGEGENTDVRIISADRLENNSLRAKYQIADEEIEVVINEVPLYFAVNFAAGFTVVKSLGLDLEPAANVICSFASVAGRGKIIRVQNNYKDYAIICDYYNSNPQSLSSALQYLGEFEHENKIAILGDMGELGRFKYDLHHKTVEYIQNAGIKKLFLIGQIMPELKDKVGSEIEIICAENAEELIKNLDKYLTGGELILIKGSRSMKLEKIAVYLGVKDAF